MNPDGILTGGVQQEAVQEEARVQEDHHLEEVQDGIIHAQNTVVERAIYPAYNTYTAEQKPEKVRIRFGNLRAKSN